MRTIEPTSQNRQEICMFLEANGIDPKRIPQEPFIYDGRRRQIEVEVAVIVDGRWASRPGTNIRWTVITRYRIAPNKTPRRFIRNSR